jgi:uncharacterized phiE125 gp8 family phage protein
MEEPRYKLKTAPIFEPVTITELKHNLRIGTQDEDDDSQDEYLQEILTAVIDRVQTDIGRQLARATYTLYLDEFPATDLLITMGPVAAISSVKYYNTSNVLTTMAAADYQLDNIELTSRLRFLETYDLYADKMNAIEIEFTNGYTDAASIPKNLKDAVILLATDRYLNPENTMLNFGMSMRQTAAERLLRNYRVQRY